MRTGALPKSVTNKRRPAEYSDYRNRRAIRRAGLVRPYLAERPSHRTKRACQDCRAGKIEPARGMLVARCVADQERHDDDCHRRIYPENPFPPETPTPPPPPAPPPPA